MTRIGFLGIAHMHARSYAKALHKLPQATLVGIFDNNLEGARIAAESMDTDWFEDPKRLLEQVDGVIICSENVFHRRFTELAASWGKHILCEKPIATTLEDAQAMIDLCEEARVKLQIAFPVRFNTSVKRVKELLDQGAIGEVLAIRGTNHGRIPGDWFIDSALSGGGAILDHTVHVVDLIRWFFGKEFVSVYAEMDNSLYGLDIDDCGLLSMELEDGIIVTQDPSWSRPTTFPTWGDVTLQIVGTKGEISLDAFAQHFMVYDDCSNRVQEQFYGEDMDYALIEDFVKMIAQGRKPSITGFDGLQALAVALAAYESAERLEVVSLPRP